MSFNVDLDGGNDGDRQSGSDVDEKDNVVKVDAASETLAQPSTEPSTVPPLLPSSSSSSSSSQQRPIPARRDEALSNEELSSILREEQSREASAKKIRNAAKRDSETITEEMKEDVIAMLRAFSLPYVIAPFEAEAQCAVLENLGLVDGVITDDSDAFLFGAQRVYKNIFTDKKFVEVRRHRNLPLPSCIVVIIPLSLSRGVPGLLCRGHQA